MRKFSIRVRLISFFLIGGLLPIAVFAGFVFWYVQARLYEDLGQRLSVTCEDIRDKIDRELFSRLQDLKAMAGHPGLGVTPGPAIDDFLKGVSNKRTYYGHDLYSSIRVLRNESTVKNSSIQISGVTRIGNDVPAMEIRLPLNDPRGGAESVLSATMDLRSLADMLEREKLSGGLDKEIVLFNSEGEIVARKDGSRGYAGKATDEFSLLADFRGKPSGYVRGSLPNRRPAMAAVNTLLGLTPPLDTLKWRIAVVQPLDDPSEETVTLIQNLRRGILIAVAVTLVSTFIISVVLLRSILLPLNRLIQATIQVRQGNLSAATGAEGSDEIGHLAKFFKEMLNQLKQSLDRLQELATTDALTGLANRRVFNEKLDTELKRARRYTHPLSLAILDIDFFKRCNDTHGHAFGDIVLKEVARLCRECCRDTDVVARYGGEEIAFILPETPKEKSLQVVERIRASVENYQIRDEEKNSTVKVTVSIGLAVFPDDDPHAKILFSLADQALYQAKESGRNRVVAATRHTNP